MSSSIRNENTLDDEGMVSQELASVIGPDKLYDMQGSEKLQEFYKKLKQTDAQLKKLKESFESNNIGIPGIGYNMNEPDRYKRSLKFTKPNKYRNIRYTSRNKNIKTFNIGDAALKDINKRSKRNDIHEPDGYVIEKKKVLIQYKPFGNKRQFPKCSHTLMDLKSHEKHLKHPFYQNSQRLDELLDHIFDKNMGEIVRDPLTLDLLFSNKAKCNHKSENKTYNSDLYKNQLNNIVSVSQNKEEKSQEDTATYKSTNQNINDNIKEVINYPLINTFTRNITLYDQAAENQNSEILQNLVKTEPNIAKNNYFTDPSFGFMAKIHGNNDLATSSSSNFGNMANKNKVSDNVHPELNYENFKSLYDQNMKHKFSPSENDHNKNLIMDSEENLNTKGLSQDHLIEMIIDDAQSAKTFDMNLDYSDILLSSTPKMKLHHTINSINQKKTPGVNLEHYIADWRSKGHGFRKLMQIEEKDDDTLGYEDLKEVLADEMEAHDETDRRVDRKKRNRNNFFPDTYNRNWKGPIPLYPDEVNAMIKQAAIENIKIPMTTNDVIGIDHASNQVSDTDYIEDYFDNKYDRLVKVAQAYSDYGVLGGSKQGSNQNKDKAITEKDFNRNKLDILKNFGNGMNSRPRKGTHTHSEGIRFEIKSGKGMKGEGVAKEPDIMGTIQKHFKILKGNKSPEAKTTGVPYIHPDFSSLPNLSTRHYSFDKIHRFDSKAIQESISAPKRSLKSVEYIDDDDVENGEAKNVTDTLINKKNKTIRGSNEFESNETKKPFKDGFQNYKNNSNLNATTTKVSDFFAMMSDWFSMLAKLSGETNLNGTRNSSTASKEQIRHNKSLEVSYPSYDSDMIENIGHRSRVLMSIEDNNSSFREVDLKTMDTKNVNINKPVELTVDTVITNPTTLATNRLNANVTTIEYKGDQIQYFSKDNANIDNKTISKRSIQTDSKLNFWNDMYDDEYGIKLDYFEKSNRHKDSVNNDNLVKKSKIWFEGKVKSIANKIRASKTTYKVAATETVPATKITSTSKPNKGKRRIRNLFNDDAEDSNYFAALTANMKKVVREAANAVRETRKLKIREDSKEETMASSLMQQLVRLMTDVVDFQVQQKTCAKLPSDLQNFLEWLISSSDKEPQVADLTLGTGREANNGYNVYESNAHDDNVGIVTPEDNIDDRTKCLDNIQAVNDLLKQYDDLNDEDKSKMTGVKEYLKNQLNFLDKKVSALDEFNMYKYNKKRDTLSSGLSKVRNANLRRRRVKSKLNKFLKTYGKKHTKTTAGNFDTMTEANIKSRELA